MVFFVNNSPYIGRPLDYSKKWFTEHFLFNLALFLFIITFLFHIDSANCYAQKDTIIEKYDSALYYSHSPRTASFYSTILPGLGQAYNKKYWKIPIVYAGMITLAYFVNYNNNYYTKFKKAYIYKVDGDPNTNADFDYFGVNTSTISVENANILIDRMDFHRRFRDMSAIGLAGFYLLNIIDATVDAYLFDYDVDQNLSLNIRPAVLNSPYSVNFGVTCSLRF
jgi:hypothetical protein